MPSENKNPSYLKKTAIALCAGSLLAAAGIVAAAMLVIVADTLSRNLFSPIEVPAGILLSIIGVPYFIYLMLTKTA